MWTNIREVFSKKWNEDTPDTYKIKSKRDANEHFLDSFQYFLEAKKAEIDKGKIKPATYDKDVAFFKQL